MKSGFHFFGAVTIAICLGSCSGEQQHNAPLPPPEPTHEQIESGLVKSHQMYIQQEQDEINQYIRQHNYTMRGDSTGMHYMISGPTKGEMPGMGDIVTVSYTISLLDGTVQYDSRKDGEPRQFRVGQDAVETGIHRAVELMHVGDKGKFILPSYLAQGLVGDKDKIPPGAVVVYDMELLAVKKKASSK
jgi:FKBP-type peptidyl-prolyl cis-trans isomerase